MLNIVTDECRILASRERCPFLVHLEVAETGLRGSDSRLYASGAPGIGTTIEEALALSAQASSAAASADPNHVATGYRNYHIPNELLSTPTSDIEGAYDNTYSAASLQTASLESQMEMPRGGWQADEAFYYHNPEDVFASNAYDSVRENEYQQLHEQMHSEYGMMEQPQAASGQRYVSCIVFYRHCLFIHITSQELLCYSSEARMSQQVKFFWIEYLESHG